MGGDEEEGLSHENKCQDVEEGIGGQIVEIQPVVEHESAEEWVERKSQPQTKWGMNTTLSWGSGVGMIYFLAGSRWAMSVAKYPASRSSLTFLSVTEEAIHLPCAPDPDIVGVLSWGVKDENLGAGAREWGRQRERRRG